MSDDPQALTTPGYWYHRERVRPHPVVGDPGVQDQLVGALAAFTGVELI